jgi:hypothetical protein
MAGGREVTQPNLFSQPRPVQPPRYTGNWEPGMRVQFDFKGNTFTGTIQETGLGNWPSVLTDCGRKILVPPYKVREAGS